MIGPACERQAKPVVGAQLEKGRSEAGLPPEHGPENDALKPVRRIGITGSFLEGQAALTVHGANSAVPASCLSDKITHGVGYPRT